METNNKQNTNLTNYFWTPYQKFNLFNQIILSIQSVSSSLFDDLNETFDCMFNSVLHPEEFHEFKTISTMILDTNFFHTMGELNIMLMNKKGVNLTEQQLHTINEHFYHNFNLLNLYKAYMNQQSKKNLSLAECCMKQLPKCHIPLANFFENRRKGFPKTIVKSRGIIPRLLQVEERPEFTFTISPNRLYAIEDKAISNFLIAHYFERKLEELNSGNMDLGWIVGQLNSKTAFTRDIMLPQRLAFIPQYLNDHPQTFFKTMMSLKEMEFICDLFDLVGVVDLVPTFNEIHRQRVGSNSINFANMNGNNLGNWFNDIRLRTIETNPGPVFTWQMNADNLRRGNRKRADHLKTEILGFTRRLNELLNRTLTHEEKVEFEYLNEIVAWKQQYQTLLYNTPKYFVPLQVPLQGLESEPTTSTMSADRKSVV